MPYELRGNKVVKKGSGELVKDHGDDHEKAVRHLRALKANVEEARLCECGAPSLGPSRLVCQRGHRLQEDWSEFDALRRGDKVYATRHHTTREPWFGPNQGRVLKGRSLTVEKNVSGVLAARDDVSGDLHTYNRPAARDALTTRPLREAWSPEARAAALAAREHNKPAGSFNVGDRVVHDAGGNTGVVAKKAKDAVHIAPDHPESVDWDAIEHGTAGGKRTLLYGHDAPMSGFKPRPAQTLKLRGQ